MGTDSGPQVRVLGRYALHDMIAAGGMATVHLGRLLGHVGFERTVAIKRLHQQFAQDPEFVSMFVDEARVVGRIRHPNVVPTLDVVAAGGELFIVMEYVQGESLARLIKAGIAQRAHVPPAFAATMLAGVLHGLHAAHEATNERGEPLGVVHRDVSPQNILVGVDGVARVLDFGVAKAAGRIQTTREGQIKGKLAYMAPEQISGEVSRAVDIYAASVVLWETLAGRRLFAGENDAHVMKLVLEGRVIPPSEVVHGVPPALDALTLRGLSRTPADRFATARDMALALEEAIAPVATSKIGAWVEATAKKTLHQRSERIAAIESSSSVRLPHTPEHVVLGAPPVAATPAVRVVEEVQTQLSSSTASALAGAAHTGSGSARRVLLLASAGGAILVAAVLLGLSVRGAPDAVPSPSSGVPATQAAPSASTLAAPQPLELTTIAQPTASSTPSATAVPTMPKTAPRTRPAGGRPSTPRPSPARRPGLDDGTSDRK